MVVAVYVVRRVTATLQSYDVYCFLYKRESTL